MKTVNKVLSLVLAVMMLLSVCSFSVFADEEDTASAILTDIDSSTTVGKAVTNLVSMGIINGYPDGTFKADNAITRAEFCVVMVKFLMMQDYIDPNAVTGFEDLDMDENYAWVRPYVAMAVNQKVINGFEDGTFRAADPVTYEQAIKMIVCALGYEDEARIPTITGDWSSGYVAKALNLRITSGTSIANKTKPTTRGVVAILTNNALEAPENTNPDLPGIDPGTFEEQSGYVTIKGVVTGTYITELEAEKSSVPRNHIMINDDIYEIDFSTSPYAFLGCHVEARIYEDNNTDYPVAKSLTLSNKTEVITVEAGNLGEFDPEESAFEYRTKRTSDKWKTCKIDDEYIVIFNEKLDEDYDIEDLEEDLVNGSVDFVDNNGDNKADVIRINSYEVHVVSSKSSSTQKISFMYEEDSAFTFPQESTSLLFSLTRNGKEIAFKDIAKWDVLNIKASDEDADGRRYYEVIVTRDTVSGSVEERDSTDTEYVVINGEEYKISDSYLTLVEDDHEDAVDLVVGETTQVYLDAFGNIVAAAKATTKNSAEKYAYLVALRQDSDDSEYDLEFRLYTTDGKFLQIGSAEKIEIDGTKYKALDEDIIDTLEISAEKANSSYAAAENFKYHQPIIYQTNSEGLVSVMHTVMSTENKGISMTMEDEDGELYYSAYADERTYSSSSKSFPAVEDEEGKEVASRFKVSSSTDIIFIPDNRNNTDDYLTFSSYSKAFSNSRKYHVEAFGLTSSGTAALVFIYCENDSRIYTSSSPWMIVASKSETKSGTVIKGYTGTSYSLKSVTVSEEDGPSISAIGKGDIIRYILDGSNELVDYQVWFDASEPAQLETINDIDDAYATDEEDIAKRIIEIHSTNTTPRRDYPTATFRLQYGTVTNINLKSEDDSNEIDEQYIALSPYIVEDGLEIEMGSDDTGFITEEIGSSVKVFSYDRGGRGSDVVAEADLSEILDYETYGEDASRVIAYTASGTLRMIYIVND